MTGPSTCGARTSAGFSSPSRNGESERWTSRPLPRSTGSAALTTASRVVCPAWRWACAAAPSSAAVTCAGRAGRLMASRALATVSPKASTDSATTPSGAMLATSAEPTVPARA